MTAAEVLGPIGSLLEHAVEYARVGFEVFPVNPQTKTPYGAHAIVGSQYDATTDVELVERCWHQHPDALIGHRIGDGILLTDIDPRHGGHDTWRELQAVHGARPATRIHVSGRGDGGGHLWWTVDLGEGETFNVGQLTAWAKEHKVGHPVTVDGAASERWSSGIDLLHRRHRYTILPPSPHPDTGKPYRWGNGRDAEVAAIPSWLRQLVVTHKTPTPAPTPASIDGDSIIDWFNATRRFADILDGWTLIKGSGDDNGSLWRHPTATAEHSASVRDGCLYVHSPNTPFEPTEPGSPHGYDVFDCYAVLQHHGDRSAAARAARELRDGVRPPLVELESLIAKEGVAERAASGTILPADFWEERPFLAHIRQAAHSRIRAPDLVLHAVLARVAAYSSHTLEIPPVAGAPGSLNYFTAAIGPSGSGKSSGSAIAGELVVRPDRLDVADNQPLGSGEGLAELYMGTVDEEDEKGKKVKVRRQVRYNAFIYGDEGAALTAMMERRGATLPEAIRRAWTGADLGQANANADRTRVIHGGLYRMGLLVGFQPELAGRLLDDSDAGTPQRFTWAYAVDPNVPDDLPEWPGELDLPALDRDELTNHKVMVRGYVRHRLGIHPDIVHELQTQAKARVRGTTELAALDAHEPLHRLKIASLLAIIDGRLDVDLEDWRLAGVIWATSCAVRSSVVESVKAGLERSEAARTEVAAHRELVVQAARLSAPQKVERVARLIGKRVHEAPERPEDGWAKRDLMHWVASRDRELLDPAISVAIEHEWIVENFGRYQPGESAPA